MAPAAGTSYRCWGLLIKCLQTGSSSVVHQPAPVAATAWAFYRLAVSSSREVGLPLSRLQELRTMPACNVDCGVRWMSSKQLPWMEIVSGTGREEQDDGEDLQEAEERRGQDATGRPATNLEEGSLILNVPGRVFSRKAWELMSTQAQVCRRAMLNLQNTELYFGYTKDGNSKEVQARGEGFATKRSIFTGQSGGSYLKALLEGPNSAATGLELVEVNDSAKPDGLNLSVGELDNLHVEVGGSQYSYNDDCQQLTTLEVCGRQMHAARFAGNAGRSYTFYRGGAVSAGMSNLMRAQTRSYKTRMANRSIRDQKKRLLVQKYEVKRAHYKAVCHDRSLPSQVRYEFALKLSKLPRNSSKTRLKNRCVFTGRSHSVYRKFGISRIVFRELASRGALTGVNKASW